MGAGESDLGSLLDIEKWAKKEADYECKKLINKILNRLERAFLNYIVGHKNRIITLREVNINVNVTIERKNDGIHLHIYLSVPKSEIDRVCSKIFSELVQKRKDVQIRIKSKEKIYEGKYDTFSGELKDVV